MSTDLVWFKSSYSDGEGECMEIALTPHTIHIRDSKTPKARTLTVTPTCWTTFLRALSQAPRTSCSH